MNWTLYVDVDELEDLLSTPYPEEGEFAGSLEGDVIILGAGGKMGPTLARRISGAIKLAGAKSRLYAVSRSTLQFAAQSIVLFRICKV